MAKRKPSFLAFYLAWANLKRWKIPHCHVEVVNWLEHRKENAVLLAHRGFAKSTLLALYNAWRYWTDPTYRILHQGDQDPTAYKTSRDTKNVLLRHPWTREWAKTIRGDVAFWWVPGADDERNPSMQAAGIMSNVTSSRADECQNDDVEVPRNITTPEAREKLRYRLGEQVHILVPGGRRLFIGTPHTHDTIYEEEITSGADVMRVPMFKQEARFEDTGTARRFSLTFKPEFVFIGIGKQAKLANDGKDYKIVKDKTDYILAFDSPPVAVVDCYSGLAWPERFDRKELETRRKKTRTYNEWDSQYQLRARPVHEIRLDPDKMTAYDIEPEIKYANGSATMWLGKARIVGASVYWDCAMGKKDGDDSVFSVIFTDDRGRLYWHVAEALTGELFDERKEEKPATQCGQVRSLVERYQLGGVTVETNGPGTFVPQLLRRELAGTGCGVIESARTIDKTRYILDAFEAPLSGRFLWVNVKLWETKLPNQMRDWIPGVKDQEDDFLDSGAGAIKQTPIRIGRVTGNTNLPNRPDWREVSGSHEVEVDFS